MNKIAPLHRGFAQVDFSEMPAPVRTFAPRRTAAHIDLPLESAEHKPPHGGRPDPIDFPDRRHVDSDHAVRMAIARDDFHDVAAADLLRAQLGDITAQGEALIAASTDGFARGVHAGWWRGAKAGAVVGGLAGMALGFAIAVTFTWLGALS